MRMTDFWADFQPDPELIAWFRFGSNATDGEREQKLFNFPTGKSGKLSALSIAVDPSSMPFTGKVAGHCRFRRISLFTNYLASLTASVPDTSATEGTGDGTCTSTGTSTAKDDEGRFKPTEDQAVQMRFTWGKDVKSKLGEFSRCLYKNGMLVARRGSDSIGSKGSAWVTEPGENSRDKVITESNGATATFHRQGGYENRMVLCVAFNVGIAAGTLASRCTSGLFYDGTPLDLEARVTFYGVEFSFTDTSSVETGYEIVRATTEADVLANKGDVIARPTDVTDCGRHWGEVSYADRPSSEKPGTRFAFGVRALMRNEDPHASAYDVLEYTIPWKADVFVSVVSEGSSAARHGTLVQLCRCGSEVYNSGDCERKGQLCWEMRTNTFGIALFEIAVPDAAWSDAKQTFRVRGVPELLGGRCSSPGSSAPERSSSVADTECSKDPSKCSKLDPEFQLTQVEHLLVGTLEFVDMTSVTVTGTVVYQRELVNGADCPVQGISVSVKSDGHESTLQTDALGRFNFSGPANGVAEVSVSHTASVCDSSKKLVEQGSPCVLADGKPRCCKDEGETCFVNGDNAGDGQCRPKADATYSVAFNRMCDPSQSPVANGAECMEDNAVSCCQTAGDLCYINKNGNSGKCLAAPNEDFVTPFPPPAKSERTFYPPSQTIVLGNENITLDPFFDTTERDLTLRVADDSLGYSFAHADIMWQVRAVLGTCAFVTQLVGDQITYRVPAMLFAAKLIRAPPMDVTRKVSATTFCADAQPTPLLDYFGPSHLDTINRRVDLRTAPSAREDYVYRTPLCVSVAAGGPLEVGKLPTTNDKSTCDNPNDFVSYKEGQAVRLSVALHEPFVGVRGSVASLGGRKLSSRRVEIGVGGTVTLRESVSGDDGECHPNAGYHEKCVTTIDGTVSGERCEEDTVCPRKEECRVCRNQDGGGVGQGLKCFVDHAASCCAAGLKCFRSPTDDNDGMCLAKASSEYTIAFGTAMNEFEGRAPTGCSAASATTLTVGTPTLESHSLRYLELEVARAAYEHCPGGCGVRYISSKALLAQDTVRLVRYVPVTGAVVLGDVPKSLTVSTGNSLVFNVLHDPPGGGSSATWSEGSTKTFEISLKNESARSKTGSDWVHSIGGGVEASVQILAAPLGIGISQNSIGGGVNTEHSFDQYNNPPAESHSSSHNKGFEVTVTVGEAISTSSDPATAGRASDIIVSGGFELLFTEVIKIENRPNTTHSVCLTQSKSTVWEPAKMTTSVDSVADIMDTMNRIQAKIDELAYPYNGGSDPVLTKYFSSNDTECPPESRVVTDKKVCQRQGGSLEGGSLEGDPAQCRKNGELKCAGQKAWLEQRLADWKEIIKQYAGSLENDKNKATTFGKKIKNALDRVAAEAKESQNSPDDSAFKADLKEDSGTDKAKDAIDEAQKKMEKHFNDLRKICEKNIDGTSPPGLLAKHCSTLANHNHWKEILDGKSPVSYDPSIMGGETDMGTDGIGEFDAIHTEGFSSFITFTGGGSALEFSHKISASQHFEFSLSEDADSTFQESHSVGEDVTIVVANVHHNAEQSQSWSSVESTSKSATHSKAYDGEVTYTLSDPDFKDKFIVQVHDNVLHGVPTFRTIGGQTCCPHEPGTTPREAMVQDRMFRTPAFEPAKFEDLPHGTIAGFTMSIDINYLNCYTVTEQGKCKMPEGGSWGFLGGDDANDYLLKLDNPWDPKLRGLIIMINGVVLGNSAIPMKQMSPGPKSFYVQMMIMPGTEDTRREFANIKFKIVSACEAGFGGGLCILPQVAPDESAEREKEEKKLGITMCADSKKWPEVKWGGTGDQCCQKKCDEHATNCVQCECGKAEVSNCMHMGLRASEQEHPSFARGRLMCRDDKEATAMPECKPPPETDKCMPKIEYTAIFTGVSWACPPDKVTSQGGGPCVPCPAPKVVNDKNKCVAPPLRRTTAGTTTATTTTDDDDDAGHDGMSLSEETIGMRSVGGLARSVQQSNHQVTGRQLKR
jgi:hypothetical protein